MNENKRLFFWESVQYFIVHKTLPYLSKIILRQFWKISFLHFLAKKNARQSCDNLTQNTSVQAPDLGSVWTSGVLAGALSLTLCSFSELLSKWKPTKLLQRFFLPSFPILPQVYCLSIVDK